MKTDFFKNANNYYSIIENIFKSQVGYAEGH